MKLRKQKRQVPELNTSALPDLIFTVLFFFMIVTHMRQTDIKVKIQTPEGTELQKLQKQYATTYLHIGKDKSGKTQIQLDKEIIKIGELAAAIRAERNKLPIDEQQYHTISIKADRDTPLSVIADVKEALKDARSLQISYSAIEKINKKP